MSTVYAKTISTLGLTNDHNSEWGMIHALLVYADANHSGSDVLTNPFAEVVRRLEAEGLNPHALSILKQRLNDVQTRYDAGTIR